MKKKSIFRLCALGLGTSFLTYSNAVQYLIIDNSTVLRDEENHFSFPPINPPATDIPNVVADSGQLIATINNISWAVPFTWDGKSFTLLSMKSLPGGLYPSENKQYLPDLFLDHIGTVKNIQEIGDKRMGKLYLDVVENDLQEVKENLDKIYSALNEIINKNPSYIDDLKKLKDENKLNKALLDSIEGLDDSQDENTTSINFIIPDCPEGMSAINYLQMLEELEKRGNNLLNSLEFFINNANLGDENVENKDSENNPPVTPPVNPVNPPVNPVNPPVTPVNPPVTPVNPPVTPVNPPVNNNPGQ